MEHKTMMIIDKLKALQDILPEKFKIEQEIKDLPKEQNTQEEVLVRMKKKYLDLNEEYNIKIATIKQLRSELEILERSREESEQRMEEIQTQREYEALDKEIRNAIVRERECRKELRNRETELVKIKGDIESSENLIKEKEKDLNHTTKAIAQKISSCKNALGKLEKREMNIIPDLDQDLLFKFQRIVRSQEGKGIVALSSGVCSGCHMLLPNQFVNNVRRGDQILFCPYCSKIVFYIETDAISQDSISDLSDVVQPFSDDDRDEFDISEILYDNQLDTEDEDVLDTDYKALDDDNYSAEEEKDTYDDDDPSDEEENDVEEIEDEEFEE